jgi:hypothetical protein
LAPAEPLLCRKVEGAGPPRLLWDQTVLLGTVTDLTNRDVELTPQTGHV